MEDRITRRLAWQILGEVEEMMSGQGVGISSLGRNAGCCAKAFFKDREYSALEEAIVTILTQAQGETERSEPTTTVGENGDDG